MKIDTVKQASLDMRQTSYNTHLHVERADRSYEGETLSTDDQ